MVTQINNATITSCVGNIWKTLMASLAIIPQEDFGGAIPRPNMDRNASVKITLGISNVILTIITLSTLGTRCLPMILAGEAPMDFAAITNSCSFKPTTCPRTSRAIPVHPVRE